MNRAVHFRGARTTSALTMALCASLALACAVEGDLEPPGLGRDSQEAITLNAITLNAITLNAITLNAITLNGISTAPTSMDRVIANPLRSDTFDWYRGDPQLRYQMIDANARIFMAYLVGCALGPGQTVEWTMPPMRFIPPISTPVSGVAQEVVPPSGEVLTGQRYIFEGSLGLAEHWAGRPIAHDGAAQRVVSACILARNNAYGQSVELSLRGKKGNGQPIDVTGPELSQYPVREGGFYGNIFDSSALHPGVRVVVHAYTRTVYRYFPVGSFSLGALTAPLMVPVYEKMFSCMSNEWTEARAYSHQRVCAAPTGLSGDGDSARLCAAIPQGYCTAGAGPIQQSFPPLRCMYDDRDNSGDGDYSYCVGGTEIRNGEVLTVFLQDACDVVRDRAFCGTFTDRLTETLTRLSAGIGGRVTRRGR